MRYKLFVVLIGLIECIVCSAQSVPGGMHTKGIDMNTIPYGTISTFNFSEKTTKGSKYLYENWKTGTIETEAGLIKDCPMNIDVQNNALEINTDKGIRVIPIKAVTRIKVADNLQSFVNTKTYDGQKVNVSGLFEILLDSEITLLKHYYVYVKEGSYNAALDMGSNEVKYIVKSRYFLFESGKLIEIQQNKKKFLDSFSDSDKEKIEFFLKEKNLKLKDQEDVVILCKFLNEKDISLTLN